MLWTCVYTAEAKPVCVRAVSLGRPDPRCQGMKPASQSAAIKALGVPLSRLCSSERSAFRGRPAPSQGWSRTRALSGRRLLFVPVPVSVAVSPVPWALTEVSQSIPRSTSPPQICFLVAPPDPPLPPHPQTPPPKTVGNG